MRRAARDALTRQKARHVRALDRARAGAYADGAHLALRQGLNFLMQMHGMLKQRIRLAQADCALRHSQQAALIVPRAVFSVKYRSRRAVV